MGNPTMTKKRKPTKLIDWVQKTEMDRRLERVREYLLTQEQLTPFARLEYDALIRRMTEKK